MQRSLSLLGLFALSLGCSALTEPLREDMRPNPVAIAKAAASVAAPGMVANVANPQAAENGPNGPPPNLPPGTPRPAAQQGG